MRVVSLTFFVFLIVVSIEAQAVREEPLLTIQAHTDKVITLAVSPDGSKVASHGYTQDGTTKVWDLQTGEFLYEIGELGDYLPSCDFSPDGTRLVAVGGTLNRYEYVAYLLNAQTGAVLKKHDLSFYLAGAYALGPSIFSPDGGRVLTAITSGTESARSLLWEIATGEGLFEFTNAVQSSASHAGAAISQDGKRIVLGSEMGAAFGVADGEFNVKKRELIPSDVSAMAFSPSGDEILVLSGRRDMQVDIFDAESAEHLQKYETGYRGWYRGPSSFSPNATAFFNMNSLVDFTSGEILRVYPDDRYGRPESVTFTRDGTRLVTGHDDGTIKVWDIGDLRTGVSGWSEHSTPKVSAPTRG